VRRQRRARRPARDDGPAAGDRGHQARRRHRRAAHRAPAALRGAERDVHRAQGPPRPRSARSARARPTRSPTTSSACSPTTRRSAPAQARFRSLWQP
jgi:Tfp pilus assembly protein PilX